MEDTPKYKKKKKSSISKAIAKATHKHEYEECIIRVGYKGISQIYRGTYCTICNKVGDLITPTVYDEVYHCYRLITGDEVINKYKNLPIKHLRDITAKYVD